MWVERLCTHDRDGKRCVLPRRALLVCECGLRVAEWQVGAKLRDADGQAHASQAEWGSVRETAFWLSGSKGDLIWIYTQVKKSFLQVTWGLAITWAVPSEKGLQQLRFKSKVKHRDMGQAFSEMSLSHLPINSWEHHTIIWVSCVWC